MSEQQHPLERIGAWVAIVGGAILAAIFLLVLANGEWPAFLYPVQWRFQFLGEYLGDFAFLAEVLIFVGPGLLLRALGERLREWRRKQVV